MLLGLGSLSAQQSALFRAKSPEGEIQARIAGFSKDGLYLTIITRSAEAGCRYSVSVRSAISDKIVYKGKERESQTPCSALSDSELRSAELTQIAPFHLSFSKPLKRQQKTNIRYASDNFTIRLRLTTKSTLITGYQLTLLRSAGLSKQISYSEHEALSQIEVAGSTLSPFEPRAVVVLLRRNSKGAPSFQFVGADLYRGFISSSAKGSDVLVAVRNGQYYRLRELIDQGSSLNVKDRFGRSPLMLALHEGTRTRSLAILLSEKTPKRLLNVTDPSGESALFYAVKAKNKEVWQLLIQRGAKTSLTSKRGITALDYYKRAFGGA